MGWVRIAEGKDLTSHIRRGVGRKGGDVGFGKKIVKSTRPFYIHHDQSIVSFEHVTQCSRQQ
jgi:hypothetical protein